MIKQLSASGERFRPRCVAGGGESLPEESARYGHATWHGWTTRGVASQSATYEQVLVLLEVRERGKGQCKPHREPVS